MAFLEKPALGVWPVAVLDHLLKEKVFNSSAINFRVQPEIPHSERFTVLKTRTMNPALGVGCSLYVFSAF